jgi:hypothetical protein
MEVEVGRYWGGITIHFRISVGLVGIIGALVLLGRVLEDILGGGPSLELAHFWTGANGFCPPESGEILTGSQGGQRGFIEYLLSPWSGGASVLASMVVVRMFMPW